MTLLIISMLVGFYVFYTGRAHPVLVAVGIVGLIVSTLAASIWACFVWLAIKARNKWTRRT